MQPELKVGGEYDDNASLAVTASNEQEIEGLRLQGSLGIDYSTERTNFNVRPVISSRKYDEEPDVDSTDGFIDFNWGHRTVKSRFGLRGNYAQESVRTAERSDPVLDQDDPDQIPDDDSGILFTQGDRQRLLLAPEFTHEFSPRTSFVVRGEYLDVGYDDVLSTSFVDFSDFRIETALLRSLTERTTGFVGVGMRRFDNAESEEDFDGVGAAIGLQSRLSETTQIRGEIGYEEAELTSTGESDRLAVANFSIVRRMETVTMLAQYSRSIAPGGIGRVSERDNINFNIRKRFSERVAGGVGIRASSADNVVSTTTTPTTSGSREFLQFRAQFEYALSQNLSVEANYRYSDIDRGDGEGRADSNSLTFWFVWRPNPIVN